jgi:hypothetical protein
LTVERVASARISLRRLLQPFVVIALLMIAIAANPSPVRAAPPQMSPPSANLIRRLQIGIVAGRVEAKGAPNRVQPNPKKGANETLRIQAEAGETLLRYEKMDDNDHLLIELGRGSSLSVMRTPGPEPAFKRLRFEQFSTLLGSGYQATVRTAQHEKTGVRLEVGEGDSLVAVEAPGIWQLLLVEPDLCREHLNGVLDLLHANWRLGQLPSDIEEQLVLLVQAGDLEVTSYWDELIERLGDNSFSVRRRADRLLRQAGVDVLPYLHAVDVGALDAEQRMRIREITRGLSSGVGEDTPRLAAWQLVGDVSVWLALLDRGNSVTQTVARERLEDLLGRTIEFDPTADAEQRSEQWSALHTELKQMGLLTVRRVAVVAE